MSKFKNSALLLIAILLSSDMVYAAIDGWNENFWGSYWSFQLATRANDLQGWFDLSSTFHSSKALQISYPWGKPSSQGDYGALKKTFVLQDILPSGVEYEACSISVYVKDTYQGSTSGYHFKQILLDEQLLWEDDVAGDEASYNNGWIEIKFHITEYVDPETPFDITLRIYDKLGVKNFGVDVFWDNFVIYFDDETDRKIRNHKLYGTLATYCGFYAEGFNGDSNGPTDEEDFNDLISEVDYSNSNTYAFLFWYENDSINKGHRWQLFNDYILDGLTDPGGPNVKVWAYLVPPSESQPICSTNSEPYQKDYIRWAQELAGLSLENEGLVAMAIDDFDQNLDDQYTPDFTPEYVNTFVKAMHDINPLLAFIPVAYYRNLLLLNQSGLNNYAPNFDAVLFPYLLSMHSDGKWDYTNNLWNTTNFRTQVEEIKDNLAAVPYLNPDPLLIVDVYAWKYMGELLSSPEYVLEIGQKAIDFADGVCFYPLQRDGDNDGNKELRKREVIRNLFSNGFVENENYEQKIYVFSPGDQIMTTSDHDSKMENYIFSTYWFDATGYQNFSDHQYNLTGDFDGDGYDEIAVFYDYGDDSSSPQRIFVYEADHAGEIPTYSLDWVEGDQGEGSWLNTTVSQHNFDDHQYSLIGDFDGNGKDEIAIFYDFGDAGSDSQFVFVYKKNGDENEFGLAAGIHGRDSWLATDVNHHNFDDHQYSLIGDFDGNGKDEIAIFYDLGDAGSDSQFVFVYKKRYDENEFILTDGEHGRNSWLATDVNHHNFDDHQYSLVGDFDGNGKDEIAIFYDLGDASSDSQFVFVYKKKHDKNEFILTDGEHGRNSWLATDVYHHNFDDHQYGLAGDFDGDGIDEFAVFYDCGNASNSRQKIFIYRKLGSANEFYLTAGSEDSASWFNQELRVNDFDCHRFPLVGQFYDEDSTDLNRDEIVVFYDETAGNETYKIAAGSDDPENEENSAGNLPFEFELSQNYPNPFNLSTIFRFSIPEKANVNLRIYDILGRSICTLAAAEMDAGYHEVFWDGKSDLGHYVSSGIYFYKLEAGDFNSVKKMLVLK